MPLTWRSAWLVLLLLATVALSASLDRAPEHPSPKLGNRADGNLLNIAGNIAPGSSPMSTFFSEHVLIAHCVFGWLAWQCVAPVVGFLVFSSRPWARTTLFWLRVAVVLPFTFMACIMGAYSVQRGKVLMPVSAHAVLGWMTLALVFGAVVLPPWSTLGSDTSTLRRWSILAITILPALLALINQQVGFAELIHSGAVSHKRGVALLIAALIPFFLCTIALGYAWYTHRKSASPHSFGAILLNPTLLHSRMVPPPARVWDNSSSRGSFVTANTDDHTLTHPGEEDGQGWVYVAGRAPVPTDVTGWEGAANRDDYEKGLLEQNAAYDPPLAQPQRVANEPVVVDAPLAEMHRTPTDKTRSSTTQPSFVSAASSPIMASFSRQSAPSERTQSTLTHSRSLGAHSAHHRRESSGTFTAKRLSLGANSQRMSFPPPPRAEPPSVSASESGVANPQRRESTFSGVAESFASLDYSIELNPQAGTQTLARSASAPTNGGGKEDEGDEAETLLRRSATARGAKKERSG